MSILKQRLIKNAGQEVLKGISPLDVEMIAYSDLATDDLKSFAVKDIGIIEVERKDNQIKGLLDDIRYLKQQILKLRCSEDIRDIELCNIYVRKLKELKNELKVLDKNLGVIV